MEDYLHFVMAFFSWHKFNMQISFRILMGLDRETNNYDELINKNTAPKNVFQI